jgi:Zn-dependent M16 (insulinase) family peptidase
MAGLLQPTPIPTTYLPTYLTYNLTPTTSLTCQDFYNLVDVYLDAVFHPRCISDPKVFEQEGWHYELDKPGEDVTYKGVVFNEMKGVYSSPDSVYYRVVQQSLFPDNTYRHDSGGDPEQIPALSYAEFQAFHAQYYSASNARLWFYGDDDPLKRLELLDKVLSEFGQVDVSSAVETQPLLTEPRRVVHHYAAGDLEEGEVPKAYVGVSWVMTDAELDTETELALGFLDFLMLGTNASPLRKAMNDSGLGAAVIGGGIDDELKQPVFSLGLKGVDPENAEKVEALIMAKLEELEKVGFSSTAIEAAVNSIEFSMRENNTGSFPRGLSLMLRSVGAWIYDRDPFQPIQWEDALNSFKAKLASGSDVFGPLIRKYILDNKHRVSVTLLPDATLAKTTESEEKGRIATHVSGLSADQLGNIAAETAELRRRQETPDTPEALKCVPTLQLSDLNTKISTVPTDVTKIGGSTLLTHDLFTNNVLYAEVLLDMGGLPGHLLPLVPLFCRSLTQMGTATESFVELTERIGRKTGGLSVSPFTTPVRGQTEPIAKIMVRGKAMGDKAGDMMQVGVSCQCWLL